METLLHSVWKHKWYASGNFRTSDGAPFEIIDPGLHNSHAGPDFFNAKIKTEDTIWVGNIEIHERSSDWYKHKHEQDKAYNSVILHVVAQMDREIIQDESGRTIPQWEMQIPASITTNYDRLVNSPQNNPCLGKIPDIDPIYLTDWKNALLTERLERKMQTILTLLEQYAQDWNEVFYICLARNFGFGINNDAFERLAKSLPLKYILKHQDSGMQVEALFLGQAGLLEEDTICDEYFQNLRTEYQFLQKKYSLQALEAHLFKRLRIRPGNFPHIKIVQLASLIRRSQTLFSQMLEMNQLAEFQSLFNIETEAYWLTHYHFEKTSASRSKKLGLSSVNILLINTIVPILFAYGKQHDQPAWVEKALQLLESIPPESNFIVTAFSRTGIKVDHAGDSQALIQLQREYCEKKKCMYCRIGYKFLTK